MQYYQFTKQITDGPNGTTLTAVLPVDDNQQRVGNELGTIDGTTYISLPDDAVLPDNQPIEVVPVVMTDALKEQLKAINPWCKLVDQQIRAKIRERYDGEDEMYLTRISVGTVMGVYQFQPGEQQAVLDYGAYVEGIRQWGKEERAKVGL